MFHDASAGVGSGRLPLKATGIYAGSHFDAAAGGQAHLLPK